MTAPNTMRILFATPYYYPEFKFGGPPKRLHAMARMLQRKGHLVEVVTVDSRQPKWRGSTECDGVTVQYLSWIGKAPYAWPTRTATLRSTIESSDIVHCFGLYNLICPLASWFSIRLRKPFLIEPMGMYAPRVRSVAVKRFYNATLTNWMARRTSMIVATSEIEAAELEPLRRFCPVVVRRNGIDLDEFTNLSGGEEMRRRWRISPDEHLILYLGRISSKKNLRDLVRAFTKANVPSSKLVIAGPVSEPRYLRDLQGEIKASNRGGDILVEGPVYGAELKSGF